VLEAFADAVAACEDPALRAVLDRLCSLHALHRIEAERGWFQEHGRLTPQRSKAVVKAVNALCAEVRDDAGLLVAAFGVPEPALADAGPVAEADREARLERLRNPAPQAA
jgi:acyl-CoA oxidase